MWKRFKLYLLTKLYRFLVVNVYTVDRDAFCMLHKYTPFCDFGFATNQGYFRFSFKTIDKHLINSVTPSGKTVYNYVVELEVPPGLDTKDSPLHNKLIVVLMIHTRKPNYEAIAKVLLDMYIKQFNPDHQQVEDPL